MPIPGPGPIAIPDAKLVGSLDVADEVTLVDAELTDEVHDRRYGRLPYSDRVDPCGLDQPQPHVHPASDFDRAAAAFQPAVPPPTIAALRIRLSCKDLPLAPQ